MKILMLADKMDIGGAETHVYELSRALFSMGHEVVIFSKGGCTARLASGFARTTEPKGAPLLSLISLLRNFKPDVIHAHTRRTLLLAKAAAALLPFPVVFTVHARFSSSLPKRLLTLPPRRTIAVSADLKRHFESSFGAKDLTVIENGIDIGRFEKFKRPDGLKIISVSRLDDDCSLAAELLCRIAPRLAESDKSLEIILIGGGSRLSKIREMAAKANGKIGREAVKCLGAQSDLPRFLKKASLFVGVSRAALEAMSCGIPTIICGNEGFFGLCDKEGFYKCADGNFCARGLGAPSEEKLYSSIRSAKGRLNECSLDHSERVRERFSSLSSAKATVEVYRKAVDDLKKKLKYDIALCGYYGYKNLGDELVKDSLQKAFWGKRIAILGKSGIRRRSVLGAACALRASRLVILGGGSLLQDSTSRRSLAYYLFILKIAKLFGRRTMLYANGFGPLSKRGEEACKRALLGLDALGFRDKDSFYAAARLLGNKPLYLSCDPALELAPAECSVNRIAIFIRGRDFSSELASSLAAALCRLKDEHPALSVVFSAMNQKEDANAARRLADSMPFPCSALLPKDQDELKAFISSSLAVVSGRLHALVVAASACRPFIALCFDPKLSGFARECGIDGSLLIDTPSAERLFYAMDKVVKDNALISQCLQSSIPRLCQRKERDIRTALYLLGES